MGNKTPSRRRRHQQTVQSSMGPESRPLQVLIRDCQITEPSEVWTHFGLFWQRHILHTLEVRGWKPQSSHDVRFFTYAALQFYREPAQTAPSASLVTYTCKLPHSMDIVCCKFNKLGCGYFLPSCFRDFFDDGNWQEAAFKTHLISALHSTWATSSAKVLSRRSFVKEHYLRLQGRHLAPTGTFAADFSLF